MVPIRVVYQSESISPGIYVLIGDNTVTNDINISLDLRLLKKADESLDYRRVRRDATRQPTVWALLLSQYKWGPLSTKYRFFHDP